MAHPPLAASDAVARVGVVGAGTMGAGIAQVAAQAGLETVIYDLEPRFLERGRERIQQSLERFVARGKLSAADAEATGQRLQYTSDFQRLADCQVVVEAVPEDLALKSDTFRRLGALCPPDVVLATNTSSLSVTEIALASGRPDRVVGMHFFNPPPLLRLVEVVRGTATAEPVVQLTLDLCRRLDKVPVLCRDTPGFIVNRVARPFYLEALRIVGEGLADVPTVDAGLRAVGFPMGPFQLMDMIGVDVNFSVTRSVFEQRFFEPRFRPHLLQQDLVRSGRFGRKSGSGFYDYATDPPRVALPAIGSSAGRPPLPEERWRAVLPAECQAPWVAARVLSGIVNEAHFALGEGVASHDDIDTAMRLGTNYPRGPFAWAEQLGPDLVLETLLALEDWYRDAQHPPAPALRARVG